MTDREIVRYIDSGANYYVSLFGNAPHMRKTDKEYYSYIEPKADEYGISFVYHVRVDDLPLERKKEVIAEIKSLHMPVWLDLLSSDETFFLLFGKEKVHGQTKFAENDEIYMAVLPEEKTACHEKSDSVRKVQSAREFALWAQIANDVLSGGAPDIHPVYHFPLCENGVLNCYIMYRDNIPVSVAAVMDDHGIASLEFVATIPEMRRKGLARAVCEKAVCDAFSNGAKIVTVRAINLTAAKLYRSVGFKVYNYAF